MNIKKLALISCLAGAGGCYTVPVDTAVMATPVVTPAPVVVAPQPVVAPAVVVPAYRPWGLPPRFYHHRHHRYR